MDIVDELRHISNAFGHSVCDTAADEIERLRAALAQHTFKCPEVIWGGPGHQSKHECEYHFPHPQVGEHGYPEHYVEWEVTEDYKDKEYFT